MRGTHGNEDAGFADFQAAQAVRDSYAVNREFLVDLDANLLHLRKRHRFIGFVFEVEGAAPMGFIPHKAIESDYRSILIRAYVAHHGGQVYWRVEQFRPVKFSRWVHRRKASAPTHRGKKSDLIIAGEASIPGRKFLISGRNKRSTKAGQLGKAL